MTCSKVKVLDAFDEREPHRNPPECEPRLSLPPRPSPLRLSYSLRLDCSDCSVNQLFPCTFFSSPVGTRPSVRPMFRQYRRFCFNSLFALNNSFAHFSIVPDRPSPPRWDDSLVESSYAPPSHTRNAYISYEPRHRLLSSEVPLA